MYKLPITNTDDWVCFSFTYDSFISAVKYAKVYETFLMLSSDRVIHYIEYKSVGKEGIEISWKNNPFNLDYDEDNYFNIIK